MDELMHDLKVLYADLDTQADEFEVIRQKSVDKKLRIILAAKRDMVQNLAQSLHELIVKYTIT
ncbi:MAG: hypothetical protein KKA71_04415 [Proteobacteria bacterium]|nr:hypothetical protein [Pseudomonadota bacterium]